MEVFSIDTLRPEHAKAEAVVAHRDAPKWVVCVDVAEHADVLLIRDGEIVETLGKGHDMFWYNVGHLTRATVDRQEWVADVAALDIMTNDKITLRRNLLVT